MSGYTTTAAQINAAVTFPTRPAISVAAIPALLTLLRNPDTEIAAGAAEQLATLGAQVVPALVAELGGRGLRGAGETLLFALLPAQARAAQVYRQRIEAVLASLGPECVPALTTALYTQPAATVRAVLERVLERHGATAAISPRLLAPSAF